MVRTRWFSKPLSICIDEAGVLCPNPRLAGRVIRVICREILLSTAYFQHSVGFRSDINANLMQDVCFLTRDGKFPFIFGSGFPLPAKLVARPVHARRQPLASETGSISGHSRGNHTHVPCRQRSAARHHRLFLGVNTYQTSDTEMRDCEVGPLGSALWCQACAQH